MNQPPSLVYAYNNISAMRGKMNRVGLIALMSLLLCSLSAIAHAGNEHNEHPWKKELIPDDVIKKFNIPDQTSFVRVERICDDKVILLSNAPVDGPDLYIRLSDNELLLRCPNGRIRPTNPDCYDTEEKICGIANSYVVNASQ